MLPTFFCDVISSYFFTIRKEKSEGEVGRCSKSDAIVQSFYLLFLLSFQTFAEWGVDYLKLDGCYADPKTFDTGYPSVTKALNNTKRPIVFSCSWPAYQVGQGIQVTLFDNKFVNERQLFVPPFFNSLGFLYL